MTQDPGKPPTEGCLLELLLTATGLLLTTTPLLVFALPLCLSSYINSIKLGYQFYDGPHQKINLVFKNFSSNAYHKVACFGTELNNLWQIAPISNTTGLQFDNSSLRAYFGNGGYTILLPCYISLAQLRIDSTTETMMECTTRSCTTSMGLSPAWEQAHGPSQPSPSTLSTAASTSLLGTLLFAPLLSGTPFLSYFLKLIFSRRYGQLFIRNNNMTGTNFGCTIGNTSCVSGIILYRDDKSTAPLPMIGMRRERGGTRGKKMRVGRRKEGERGG
jgi:hypothetical protein